jgi:hypothetical protein
MKEMNETRITNLIAINLTLLLMMPYYLNLLGWDIGYAGYAILGSYLFMFFSFWFFLYFIIKEIKYANEEKINFFKHVVINKLVFWGVFPFFLYLLLKLIEVFY